MKYEQIKETQETIEIKEIVEETFKTLQQKESTEIKEANNMLSSKNTSKNTEDVIDIESVNIKEEVSQIESTQTKALENYKINEDIMSEIEEDIQKIISANSIKENTKENKEVMGENEKQEELKELEKAEELVIQEADISNQEQVDTTLLDEQKLKQTIDIDEIIKNFSNLKKEVIENVKNLLISDLNFKEDFFVKLEDYILNENNIKNDLDNINILFNFIKNLDNTHFSKFLKALIAILLGYDFNTLANIIYSTVGISKMTLREYFIENELLDFNLSINDFINFVQFIVNNNLENAEKIIPLLVSLTEFKELNDNSKEKINHLVSDLIKLI